MGSNVLVFFEQREGVAHRASAQLFTPARELAEAMGGEVHALVVGHDVGHLAEEAARFGAARVHVADDAELALYRARPYRAVLVDAIEQSGAGVVLVATTFMSRDLAPRVAARLDAALATDCISVASEGKTLRVRRPMYSGKCVGEFTLAPDGIRIVSVRPNAFRAPEPSGESANRQDVSLAFSAEDTSAKTIEVIRTGGAVKDVTETDVIVAGGRSLKSEENFKILEELADVLDGACGASRAAVDAGYQPHSRQIGLTGKVVTPSLYIACGIDGAIQHLAGMRGSKVIVAINTKREAPIFDHATYGCVADLFDLVPLLTEECRKMLQPA